MNTPLRYIVLVLGVLIGLHFILTFSNEGYGRVTSFDNIKSHLSTSNGHPPYADGVPKEYFETTGNATVNAVIVMLARNSDLNGIIQSMKQLEWTFNHKYHYPYVFLNEEEFDNEFKTRTSELTDSKVEYGLIPHDHWFQPDSIDEVKATAAREDMIKNNVIYGHSVPYRNMCRFNSGFFYRHELLKKYKYYWRVEPDIKFFCDLNYDPFRIMQDGNKVYGFTVSLYEYPATIPTLWDTVKDGGETYNLCHFWSNFEIGDLDLWRGEAYTKFFDFLDSKGGFYYERWGDGFYAHNFVAALFARKDQIHFFEDIGYRHEPFQHCPQGASHARGKCYCDPKQNFDREWYSCLNRYDKMFQ
ncbi:glycosyltransferase family 15 protein [Flagelloscypha sp. PMI_526]|nr:glycosyltransferase family 15 protein [Flagelloscypha sp. PMI_526]